MKTLFTVLSISSVMFVSGCSSVICGPKQDIAFDSLPRGARVVVYNPSCEVVFSNSTPCTATLQRLEGDSSTGCYIALVAQDGYGTVKVPLAGRRNDAYYLNVLTLGIGCVVDASNGSAWTLVPEKVDNKVVKDKAGFFYDDGLYVTLMSNASHPAEPAISDGRFSEIHWPADEDASARSAASLAAGSSELP